MATETDIRIARAVALKAAVDLVNGKAILLADIEGKAEELTGWLLAPVSLSRPAPPRQNADPGPDVPYGDAEGFHEAPPAPHHCEGCGSEMEFFNGTNASGDDYAGYRCRNQKKTHDPAEQAAEKVRHPVEWV